MRNRYLTEDGRGESCREIARYRFLRAEKGLVLLWDSEFRNDERDFYFGDQEESGLGVRVASAIRVKGGNGLIINDAGGKNGAGTWGRQMKWIDYSGLIDGRRVGILVVDLLASVQQGRVHSSSRRLQPLTLQAAQSFLADREPLRCLLPAELGAAAGALAAAPPAVACSFASSSPHRHAVRVRSAPVRGRSARRW